MVAADLIYNLDNWKNFYFLCENHEKAASHLDNLNK